MKTRSMPTLAPSGPKLAVYCQNIASLEVTPYQASPDPEHDDPEEPEPTAGDGEVLDVDEDAAADEVVEVPPQQLTPGAVRKRLARILTPKANGDFKVPKQVIDDFAGDEKDKLMAMFEKAGYKRG